MIDENYFGRRLEECIKKAGYTNSQITKELNLSKNAIGNYKNNQIPNASILYKISQILGTTMEYLLTGKNESELTDEESKIIKAYRLAPEGIQQATKKILDIPDTGKSSNSKIG
ncbi:helix-turn-helix domain-containing protein [Ruminococcus sp. OA3]|uniref:helix-turn-helix domain-containing protein n=1 Tax=Ruminococcus sp. OA3 TaxID=2914164 RepID=UPI001F0655E3|nr:helix-turn-helix transcriptional regulator [Ruminococcus sp. OA3]MCH1981794.1 helix-turn-helix domain-containing protein [Ruminococcus sp. OA3]